MNPGQCGDALYFDDHLVIHGAGPEGIRSVQPRFAWSGRGIAIPEPTDRPASRNSHPETLRGHPTEKTGSNALCTEWDNH